MLPVAAMAQSSMRVAAERVFTRQAQREASCDKVDEIQKTTLSSTSHEYIRERWVFKLCGREIPFLLRLGKNESGEKVLNASRELVPEQRVNVVDDAVLAAEQIARQLQGLGYQANWSIDSLKEIDRFIEENSSNGQPKPYSPLSRSLGLTLFALGGYTGEVIRRNSDAAHWAGDDQDPHAEMNLSIGFGNGSQIWPVQRVAKRLTGGSAESIYVYALIVTEKAKGEKAATAREPRS